MTVDTEETRPLDDEHSFSKMTKEQIAEWKSEALARPSDFGYGGDNEELFETWSLGITIETRDSGIREKANASAIKTMLKADPSLEEDWEIVGCRHWAVGWVDHLSFRVLDEDGSISRISRVIKGIFDSLSEYPVLDDGLYSEMEYEETIGNIKDHYPGSSSLKDDVPEDWPTKMYSWWSDADDYEAIDDQDGRGGGYPSKEQFEECARALGFWDTSEDEDEEE
jgi:hypothetical protein